MNRAIDLILLAALTVCAVLCVPAGVSSAADSVSEDNLFSNAGCETNSCIDALPLHSRLSQVVVARDNGNGDDDSDGKEGTDGDDDNNKDDEGKTDDSGGWNRMWDAPKLG